MKYAYAMVGAASAALGPLPGDSTAFPVYNTLDSPVANDLTGNGIKSTYVTDANSAITGTTRGYRNNLYILPLQTVSPDVTATNTSACSASATGYRSWWAHELAKVGAYVAPNAGTDDAGKNTALDAGGAAKFVICSSIDTIINCNGRTFNKNNTEDGTDITKLKERWVTYKTVGKANVVTFTATNLVYQYAFNEDIALAAQYHSAGTVATDGTIWCSAWKSTLAVDGTVVDSAATKGYSKMSKCSWMYAAADGTVAPSVMIKETTNQTFLMQYIEFHDVANLGSDGILATTDTAASFFQGVYATASGPFMNPFTRLGTTALDTAQSSTTEWNRYNNPGNWGAGSVGRARYHTEDAGNMSVYSTATGDIAIFWKFQALKKAEFDKFNTAKTDFEAKKTTFVTALADRDAQLKDIFKMNFETAIEIPDRPENVTPPAAYGGPTINLAQYIAPTSKSWNVKKSLNEGNAGLVTGMKFDDVPALSENFANRIGYLYASADTAATVVDTLGVGHVFGRLG